MNLNKRAVEMKEFFNSKIDTYDNVHQEFIKGKEKIVDFIPKDTKKIIDLGTGTGLQLVKLYEKYPSIETIAIDVSDKMLNKLKEKNISNNIKIVNESFFDYDFGNNIDAVISTQALHHFEPKDKIKLYKKVYNCLKVNGIFIIEDYFANTDEDERKGFEDYKNLVKGKDKHYDTPLTIEHEIEILKQSGFENINTCIEENYKIIISKKGK